MSEEGWDRTIDLNLKGTFFACHFAIPHLQRTEGCIVNLSSDAGLVGTAEAAISERIEGAVSRSSRGRSPRAGPEGVRVSAVCPNHVDTPMLAGQARDYGGGDPEATPATLLAFPHGKNRSRFIRPEEVAALIAPSTSAARPMHAPVIGAASGDAR